MQGQVSEVVKPRGLHNPTYEIPNLLNLKPRNSPGPDPQTRPPRSPNIWVAVKELKSSYHNGYT